MTLTESQRDALVELLNIGFGRAGAALSKLTGQRILLEVPQVAVHPVAQLDASLGRVTATKVASVHQVFAGPVGGDALLILDPVAASTLKELLTDEPALPLELDASSREVLTEVGNVILSSCLSAFGDMLQVTVSFSVPRIHVESLEGLLRSLQVDHSDVQYMLLVATRFQLSKGEVGGYLMVAIGISSLSIIAQALANGER